MVRVLDMDVIDETLVSMLVVVRDETLAEEVELFKLLQPIKTNDKNNESNKITSLFIKILSNKDFF